MDSSAAAIGSDSGGGVVGSGVKMAPASGGGTAPGTDASCDESGNGGGSGSGVGGVSEVGR